jgi:hypothetical protein
MCAALSLLTTEHVQRITTYATFCAMSLGLECDCNHSKSPLLPLMETSQLQYTHANMAYCALHQYIVTKFSVPNTKSENLTLVG